MNEKITDFQGVVAHIDRNNIDTDQIIPTEYLKSIKKYGYEDYLFDGWRYIDTGRLGQKKETRALIDDFILNQEIYSKSSILLTRDNFGCGSSREHAVWALRDFGIKAVIAITALIPKSLNAHTACSLLEPQPKLSLVSNIDDLEYIS